MINYHARWVVPVASQPLRDGTVSVAGRRDRVRGPAPARTGRRGRRPGRRGAAAGPRERAYAPRADGNARTARRHAVRPVDPHAHRGAVGGVDRRVDAGRRAVGDCRRAARPVSRRTPTRRRRESCSRRSTRCTSAGSCTRRFSGPRPTQRESALATLRAQIDALRPWESDLVRLGVSPHAPYTVHEDLLDRRRRRLRSAPACRSRYTWPRVRPRSRFLREGEGPFADGLRARGIPVVRRSHSPVHLLVELGVVLGRPLLIHCVRVDETDIAFIAEYGCPVAHCPTSNAILGHGVAPLREMLDAGVIVGLGSDSLASNDRLDILGRGPAGAAPAARASQPIHRALERGRGDAGDRRGCARPGARGAGRHTGTGQGG